jgi:hypothetical protein
MQVLTIIIARVEEQENSSYSRVMTMKAMNAASFTAMPPSRTEIQELTTKSHLRKESQHLTTANPHQSRAKKSPKVSQVPVRAQGPVTMRTTRTQSLKSMSTPTSSV